MTTQAQDLGKTLGASMIAAADKHGTAIVAASIHIHTGLSQIAEALGYRNPAGRRQDAPGTPRMPGARETPADPLRGAQDATQPEWATATVVQDNGNDLWGRHGNEFTLLGDLAGAGTTLGVEELEAICGPLTVILDGDGNPPHPQACAERVAELQEQLHAVARERDEALSSNEPAWLDADELGQLPLGSVVIPRSENVPRVNHHGGWFRTPGGIGVLSRDIAPARVLWTPETDR